MQRPTSLGHRMPSEPDPPGSGPRRPGAFAQVAEPAHLPAAHGAWQQRGTWGTSCLDKAVGLVWLRGGSIKGQPWPNVGLAQEMEQMQRMHNPTYASPGPPASATAGAFAAVRSMGSGCPSSCSSAVHVQAAAQLTCEHALPHSASKNHLYHIGWQPPGEAGHFLIGLHALMAFLSTA